MLCCGSGSDDVRTDMLCDLRCGNADAAAGRMDKNGLVAFEAAHDHDKLPGGEIIDRYCSGFQRRIVAQKTCLTGHANSIRRNRQIASPLKHRVRSNRSDAVTYGIDVAADR